VNELTESWEALVRETAELSADAVARVGASMTQLHALFLLGGDGLGMTELARTLGVTLPAATELVGRLVDAGHAERHGVPTDRRRVIVRRTPQGDALLDRARASMRPLHMELLEVLTDDDLTAMTRSFTLLAGAARQITADRRSRSEAGAAA
jgi:DNA-binding MarR family transcriptional regulator